MWPFTPPRERPGRLTIDFLRIPFFDAVRDARGMILAMNTRTRVGVVLLMIGAAALTACVSQPPPSQTHRKLKLETVQRPFGPTTYQYREVNE